MEVIFELLKSQGVGVAAVAYLLWMFNGQNKKNEAEKEALIQDAAREKEELRSRVKYLEELVENKFLGLIEQNQRVIQDMTQSFRELCDKIGRMKRE